jgi:type II secretory pathway pseudopilin PulG
MDAARRSPITTRVLNMTYQPNKPLPTDLLSDSQKDLKNNFTVANNVMTIDHYPFDDATANKGRHKDVHIVKRVGNPGATAGAQIVFSKDYTPDTAGGTADTQLFSLTGAGGLSQLTGNSAATDGWNWIGGMLIQWGRKTGLGGSWPTTDQTLTFKNRSAGAIPFPNNCYAVTVTFIGPTSNSTGDICINSVSATNFHWQFTGSSSASFGGFYWIAVGN